MSERNGRLSETASKRRHLAERLSGFWERWGGTLLWVGVAYSIVAAVGRLRYALPYLLTDVEEWAAVDFKYRYDEVALWFAGLPVYGALERLTYPPATYALLWPAMGWMPLGAARAVWAVTILAAAVVIASVVYFATAGHSRSVRLLVALLAFAAYPIQVTVFVGQLPMHVVALAAGATLLLAQRRKNWATDIAAAALLAASLAKPTLTPPLVAAVLIGTRRWRPVVLTSAMYVVLAFVGAAAQPGDIVTLHRQWLESSANPSLTGGIAEGVPSMHMLLSRAGIGEWAPVASVVVLAAFAAWAWRHRTLDLWVLVGASAVVARLWSYHREYDDAVLLLATVGVLRVARGPDPSSRWIAGGLFAATWVALLTPTWILFSSNVTVIHVVQGLQTMVWVGVLAFLLLGARHHLQGSAQTR